MFQLQADGENERHFQFDKGLAVVNELKVGGFVLKIDGDGPVFAGLTGCVAHGSPSGQMPVSLVTQDEGNAA